MDYTQFLNDFPEINPANYTEDDVIALNAWGLEAHAAVEALQARVAILQKSSVTNILLAITPGDGSGHEVYAESTDDVVNLLTKLDDDNENLQARVLELENYAQVQHESVVKLDEWNDTLAAKLAALEGQEPLYWLGGRKTVRKQNDSSTRQRAKRAY